MPRMTLAQAYAHVLVAALLCLTSATATAQIHRCTINGTVTFQRDPCPSGEPRKPATAADLNAANVKQPTTGQDRTGNWGRTSAGAVQTPTTAAPPAAATAPATAGKTGYRCDGRKRCPQMTSCDEARFFLANCPGVQMDGDGDGIPCEEQLCGH